MRFEQITIKNYRQYESISLDFPDDGDKDLHVMIAKNGVGKTTLLNAINWCLYSDEPHLGDKSKSLPVLNASAIKKASEAGKDSEEVFVEIRARAEESAFIFHREMSVYVTSSGRLAEKQEKFSVAEIPTGAADPIIRTGKEADSLVSRFLPDKIREYFFFDGEQLDNYFKSDPGERIKNSIHAISQVNLLTDIAKRMDQLIAKKEREAGKRTPNINALTQEVEARKDDYSKRCSEIEAKQEIITANNVRIEELNTLLNGFEDTPELNRIWQELQSRQAVENARAIELNQEFISFIQDAKIALAFYEPAIKTLSYIKEKREAKQLPAKIDASILRKTLNDGACEVCGQDLSDEARASIEKMLHDYEVSTATSSTLISIENELQRIVKEAKGYKRRKDQFLEKVKRQNDVLRKIESDIVDADKRIQAIGNSELIARYHEERKNLQIDCDKAREWIGARKASRAGAHKLLEQAQEKLEKAMRKETKCKELTQEIDFLKEAQTVAKRVEKQMMDEVRETMEKATSDYFHMFIWKKNTFDRVTLDKNYQVDLIHRDGYSCLGSSSAGERALLALAFTLAMHRVSGFNAPLFIDTPLARISDENRTNFAEVLSDVGATKEIIMTFTPSEYSKEISTVFDGILASRRILDVKNEENTVISEG